MAQNLYILQVATVLTVYGIETSLRPCKFFHNAYLLQQYLPFTVLKLIQRCTFNTYVDVATVLTVYGIET